MHAPRPRCQEGGEGRSRSAGPKQAGATAQRSTQCNQSGDDETNMLVDIRPLRSDSLGLARLSTIRSSRRSCSGLDPEPGPGIICKSLPYLRSSGSARSKSKESLLASQHVARHSSLHCMPFVLSPRRWAATASSRRRLDQALSWGISSFDSSSCLWSAAAQKRLASCHSSVPGASTNTLHSAHTVISSLRLHTHQHTTRRTFIGSERARPRMCTCISGQLLLWQMRENVPLLPKEICPGIHLHKHSHTKARSYTYTAVTGVLRTAMVQRMYVYTCIRSIVLYMFDLCSAALGACCLLRTGSGYQHHYTYSPRFYKWSTWVRASSASASTDNGTVHLANMIKPTLPSISLFHGPLLLILVAHCLRQLVRWRPVRTSPGELSPPPGSSCRSLGPLRCFPICRHTLLETTSFFFPTR